MKQGVSGDVLAVGREATLDLSVVCPFYNEELIIADAIESLCARLDTLAASWELIVVNDGSSDGSARLAAEAAAASAKVRVLGYGFNRGRGHALRTGIEQARGRVIITTEIDLSWGEDIIERLYRAIQEQGDVDIVVASPHLEGGGYKNVPLKRVLFSRLGNWVIRASMSNIVSMNTGMTRAYRREVIRSLPLEEDGKEFHLEVVLKAQALKYRFGEIPAVLEWKEYKYRGGRVKRKSSSKVNKLILSHSLFSLFANPVRYVWGLSGICLLLAAGAFTAGVVRYVMGLVSVYLLLITLALTILALLLFSFGVIAQQAFMIQSELWRLKHALLESGDRQPEGRAPGETGPSGRDEERE